MWIPPLNCSYAVVDANSVDPDQIMHFVMTTNSVDPDLMSHSVASDLGLYCLPVTLLGHPD